MKLITFSFLAVLLCGLAHGYPPYLGQPGCKTDEELNVKYYRFLNNKTKYWKCVEKDKPAIVERCPNGMGYLDPEKQCVHFSRWYYTPPFGPPPSSPNGSYYEPSGPYEPYAHYKGPYGPYGPYAAYPYKN